MSQFENLMMRVFVLIVFVGFCTNVWSQDSLRHSSNDSISEVSGFRPSYPRGWELFANDLSRLLKYPREAKRNGTHGKVVLRFYVEIDGSVKDVEVLEGIGDGCDEEAIRALLKLVEQKRFIPGSINDENMRWSLIRTVYFRKVP